MGEVSPAVISEGEVVSLAYGMLQLVAFLVFPARFEDEPTIAVLGERHKVSWGMQGGGIFLLSRSLRYATNCRGSTIVGREFNRSVVAGALDRPDPILASGQFKMRV